MTGMVLIAAGLLAWGSGALARKAASWWALSPPAIACGMSADGSPHPPAS